MTIIATDDILLNDEFYNLLQDQLQKSCSNLQQQILKSPKETYYQLFEQFLLTLDMFIQKLMSGYVIWPSSQLICENIVDLLSTSQTVSDTVPDKIEIEHSKKSHYKLSDKQAIFYLKAEIQRMKQRMQTNGQETNQLNLTINKLNQQVIEQQETISQQQQIFQLEKDKLFTKINQIGQDLLREQDIRESLEYQQEMHASQIEEHQEEYNQQSKDIQQANSDLNLQLKQKQLIIENLQYDLKEVNELRLKIKQLNDKIILINQQNEGYSSKLNLMQLEQKAKQPRDEEIQTQTVNIRRVVQQQKLREQIDQLTSFHKKNQVMNQIQQQVDDQFKLQPGTSLMNNSYNKIEIDLNQIGEDINFYSSDVGVQTGFVRFAEAQQKFDFQQQTNEVIIFQPNKLQDQMTNLDNQLSQVMRSYPSKLEMNLNQNAQQNSHVSNFNVSTIKIQQEEETVPQINMIQSISKLRQFQGDNFPNNDTQSFNQSKDTLEKQDVAQKNNPIEAQNNEVQTDKCASSDQCLQTIVIPAHTEPEFNNSKLAQTNCGDTKSSVQKQVLNSAETKTELILNINSDKKQERVNFLPDQRSPIANQNNYDLHKRPSFQKQKNPQPIQEVAELQIITTNQSQDLIKTNPKPIHKVAPNTQKLDELKKAEVYLLNPKQLDLQADIKPLMRSPRHEASHTTSNHVLKQRLNQQLVLNESTGTIQYDRKQRKVLFSNELQKIDRFVNGSEPDHKKPCSVQDNE